VNPILSDSAGCTSCGIVPKRVTDDYAVEVSQFVPLPAVALGQGAGPFSDALPAPAIIV
jgi:hypothetical protein